MELDNNVNNNNNNNDEYESTPLLRSFREALLSYSRDKYGGTALLHRPSFSMKTRSISSFSRPLFVSLVALASNILQQVANAATGYIESSKASGLSSAATNFIDVIVESKHEYENNTNQLWHIFLPGATGIVIVFSDACSTEPRYDYVNIYADQTRTVLLGGKYTGHKNSPDKVWPGVGSQPPLILEGICECWVHFTTDSSKTDWGFRLTASALNRGNLRSHTSSSNIVGVGDRERNSDILREDKATTISSLEELSKPNLNTALKIFKVILEHSPVELCFILSSPSGARLIRGLLRCADVVVMGHPNLLRIFMEIITKIMLIVSMSYIHRTKPPPLSFRFPEAVSDTNRAALASLCSISMRLAAAAIENWNVNSLQGGKKAVPSDLLQSIVECAVASRAAEIQSTYPIPYTAREVTEDFFYRLVPAEGDWESTEMEFVHGNRGVRHLSCNGSSERIALGPMIPMTKDGDRAITVALKIVSMKGNGITIGIAPLRMLPTSDWRTCPGTIGWSAEGTVTVTTEGDTISSKFGPPLLPGDIVDMSILLSHSSCEVSFKRNGVSVGLAVGPVDSEAVIEMTEYVELLDVPCAIMVCLTDGADEVCFVPPSPPQSMMIPQGLSTIAQTMDLPRECVRLTAAGDSSTRGLGLEHVQNLLQSGTETWNKWFHPGTSASWVRADFASIPSQATWFSSKDGNIGPAGLKLFSYALCSANDFPSRDPVQWSVLGRRVIDGAWVVLHRLWYLRIALLS